MQKEERDITAHSRDLGVGRVESIEDLLRRRGFFDSAEREKKEEEVLVS